MASTLLNMARSPLSLELLSMPSRMKLFWSPRVPLTAKFPPALPLVGVLPPLTGPSMTLATPEVSAAKSA